MLDMLQTLDVSGSKDMLDKIETRYKSIAGLPMRLYFNLYLRNLHSAKSGTHIIVKAVKE